MPMSPLRCLCPLLVAGLLGAAELPREHHSVDGQAIPVSSRDEITIRARNDADVRHRELWYRNRDADGWNNWQKHGIGFARDTPITWAPPEGHWQIFVRIEEISGLADPVPTDQTTASAEFIIDRSAPAVDLTFPAAGAKLRSGATYEITWEATDPHLHSTPITIRWARSGNAEATVIAEALPDSGSFEWTTPSDMTADGQLEVLVTDKAGNVGRDVSGSLVLDAVAPSRNILGPSVSATQEIELAVRVTDAGPAGLASLRLYYSSDDGGTWNPGPQVDGESFESLAWTAPDDGHYLLALVATDQAGNANPTPRGRAGGASDLLIDSQAPGVSLRSPIGIADRDRAADAPVRRIFKPGDEVVVRYTIADPNIRPDGVSVWFRPQADGRWERIGEGLPPAEPFAWQVPNLATDSAAIRVVAVDAAGNSGEAISTETFAIDNQVERGSVDVEL